ncbi:hypothetical protein ScalyP_jg2111 [Parmales sp. scaly parma]|nr:hypothetical protein ScalyP_jg2111 [Parmales sp. scaly parma]
MMFVSTKDPNLVLQVQFTRPTRDGRLREVVVAQLLDLVKEELREDVKDFLKSFSVDHNLELQLALYLAKLLSDASWTLETWTQLFRLINLDWNLQLLGHATNQTKADVIGWFIRSSVVTNATKIIFESICQSLGNLLDDLEWIRVMDGVDEVVTKQLRRFMEAVRDFLKRVSNLELSSVPDIDEM